jgi:hypothetical protein
MSLMPQQYRRVAFTDVGVELDEDSLRAYFLSHEVYRRTEFVIARFNEAVALVRVTTATSEPLFCPVTDISILATPDETILLSRPEVDTGVPAQMTAVALAEGKGHRCVVVRGKYEHVNFILDPEPRNIHVLDVAPPWPAKLIDQVTRILDTAEGGEQIVVLPQVVDLDDLAVTVPAEHYLLPCRGGGIDIPGVKSSFLDEVPPEADWVLVGCDRSRAIHDHFYPDQANTVQQVNTCPRKLARKMPIPAGDARLTKCCLLEDRVEVDGSTVIVPWGASLAQVAEGLSRAAELATGADGQPPKSGNEAAGVQL